MTIINTQIKGQGGVQPVGTLGINTNGVHNVAQYEYADVQVPTTAPAYYVEKTVVNGKLQNSTNIINLNGATDVGNGVLAYAYSNTSFPVNTSADLSGLTTLSGNNACQYMFQSCSGLTSVNLSSLTTISGSQACQSMFANCSGLKSVDLSGLTTISGSGACSNMFNYNTNLTSVNLSSLTTISGSQACMSMFNTCTGLTTAKFNALNIISVQPSPSYGQMFGLCYKLASVEFGGLTASTFSSSVNQLQYLFNSSTGSQATGGCTVHFPSNFDPSDPNHTFDASTLTGYPTFGGSASYIHLAFDLPATE